jgi:dynactin complex subunit
MKLKNALQKHTNKNFKRDLAYEEWLKKFVGVPTSKELDEMKKSFQNRKIKPFNNIYYQPFQGA